MSKIEWTDATWNPIAGCSLVSPGCTNCYAMKLAARIERMTPSLEHYHGLTRPSKAGAVWTGKIGIAPDSALLEPLRWKKPRRVFVNSMSDLFHEGVPDAVIDRVFAVMALTPQHTYQVLTKRSKRMQAYLGRHDVGLRWADAGAALSGKRVSPEAAVRWTRRSLPNVWLGVSCEDQQRHNERRRDLEQTPAAVRFLSIEPMLGPIDLDLRPRECGECQGSGSVPAWGGYPGGQQCPACAGTCSIHAKLDWVIVGGESGPGARPMLAEWAISIRDQCARARVPFFFKQWGEWLPFSKRTPSLRDLANTITVTVDGRTFRGNAVKFLSKAGPDGPWAVRLGKKAAGRMLEGREHNAYPQGAQS